MCTDVGWFDCMYHLFTQTIFQGFNILFFMFIYQIISGVDYMSGYNEDDIFDFGISAAEKFLPKNISEIFKNIIKEE